MQKITTPLTRFKEAHPSVFKGPSVAIEKLSRIDCQKVYYVDKQTGFTVSRHAGIVQVTGDRGWTHEATAQRINKAYVQAKVDAVVYKTWMDLWGKEESITYTFGPYKVTGTREKDKVTWSVTNCGRKNKYKIVTSDMAISKERAEVVVLNFIGSAYDEL